MKQIFSWFSSKQKPVRYQFRRIWVTVVCTYSIGILFYADEFDIWHHALSEIGTTETLLGSENTTSMLMISLGMIVTGLQLFLLGGYYFHHPEYWLFKIKSGLLILAGAGALLAVSPNNLLHLLHSIGSGFLIGSIFFLEIIFLVEYQNNYSRPIQILITVMLVASVLFYAVCYGLNSVYKQAAQKFCVVSILLVLHQRTRFVGQDHKQQLAQEALSG